MHWIIYVVLALVAGILGLASTKPKTFRVSRSKRINASPNAIFQHINTFRNWGSWSPWEKLDPGMERTFQGPESGVGAIYAWRGSSKVGQGRMEMLESMEPSHVSIQLDFIKPFKSRNTTEFHLAPTGDATEVTWSMYGDNTFMGKVMGVFMNMDTMIGKSYDEGLANLQSLVETRDKA